MGLARGAIVAALVAVWAMIGVFSVPPARADVPVGIDGGEQRLCPQLPAAGFMTCYGLRRTGIAQPPTVTAMRPGGSIPAAAYAPAGYNPADLRAAYGLPAAGSRVTVAVVDAFDNPKAESDLAVYRSTFGLGACTTANGCFAKVNQDGAAAPLPRTDRGWAGEISLDLDSVSAICPSCRLLLVEADSSSGRDFGAAVNTAARLGASVISNSYGSPERGTEAGYDVYYDHPGVAVVASTGDNGYGVAYPASSPYVLAVGGTTLTRSPGPRGWAESAWPQGGAGCSRTEPRPYYQLNVATGCTTRSVADVAAVADPQTGIAGYDSFGENGWQVFGGTSVAAPLVAGIYGLLGGIPPGAVAPTAPYLHPGDLYDISTGSDGPCQVPALCTAHPGYDQPTGLGTPHGTGAFLVPRYATQ
jgi:hypothetical protein